MRYSPDIQKLLFRSACVIFLSSAFWALLPAVARGLTESSLGYGLLLGFFGVGAVIGAVVLQRARSKLSVEWVVSGATVVFAGVILALATLHRLPLLCFLILFGGAAWTVFMSTFNTLVQNLVPDWVRTRVLAIYLFVFQGSVCAGQHTLGRCCGTYQRKHSAAIFEHWHCRLPGASRCCAIARGKGFVGGMEPLGKAVDGYATGTRRRAGACRH